MRSSFANLVFYFIFCSHVCFPQSQQNTCLLKYTSSTIFPKQNHAMSSVLQDKSPSKFTVKPNSIIFVGAPQHLTTVFFSMIQLNVTIKYNNERSSNCIYSTKVDEFDEYDFDEKIKSNLPTAPSFFGFIININQIMELSTNKDIKFITSKLTIGDAQSLLNFCAKASNKQYSKYCELPFPYDSTTKLLAGMQAYNELISCLVPPARLFTLPPITAELSTKSTQQSNSKYSQSTVYWTQLASFLDIHTPVETLSTLIRFGVPFSRVGSEKCMMSGTEMIIIGAEFSPISTSSTTSFPCQTHQTVDYATRGIVVPSICASEHNFTIVMVQDEEKRNKKGVLCAGTQQTPSTNPLSHLHTCATSYATTIASLFGPQFYDIIVRKLTIPRVVTKHTTNATIILNIGPGSSGTRSLFTAIRQLNITARHYQDLTMHCKLYRITSNTKHPYLAPIDFSDTFSPLLNPEHQRIFWGDIPVPEMWWYILQTYPKETQFIMTDINSTKWYHSRFKYFCNNSYIKDWNGCTPPVPFSFLVNRERQIPPEEKRLTKMLLDAMQLVNINVTVSNAVYEAYRDIVKCAFPGPVSSTHLPHLFSPHPQLLWMDMTKQSDANMFWRTLVHFLRLNGSSVSPEKLTSLQSAGVPYMGSNGCYVGKKKCRYANAKRELHGVLIPSVCYSDN